MNHPWSPPSHESAFSDIETDDEIFLGRLIESMAESADIPHHRKRKRRRRRQDKPAIGARLVLDDHVKGDIGILSEDLFAELFPASITCKWNTQE